MDTIVGAGHDRSRLRLHRKHVEEKDEPAGEQRRMDWEFWSSKIRRAIADYESGKFHDTVDDWKEGGLANIALWDDGDFEALAARNHYILFAYQLLDCWVDSCMGADRYPDVPTESWPDLARALLEETEDRRTPSNPLWNHIYTLPCDRCQAFTTLKNGQFLCKQCGHSTSFGGGQQRH